MPALETLETPALILDRIKLAANCARMRDHLGRFGVPLRAHMKTAKSLEVARLVQNGEPGPITVSTLKEAEFFFAHGFADILYAVGLAPSKLARAAALVRAGCDLRVILDSVAMAAALRDFCRAHDVVLPALIEIDTDDHRAGVAPGAGALLEIGAVLAAGGMLGGVMTHAGNSYTSRSMDEIRQWARREREGITTAAERLRTARHPVSTVSIGSTPTALFGESFDGITEVRAGVYVFFDLVMVGLGVCAVEDIALSVLTTVIGHQAEKGWLITDGGWTAMSRDRGTASQAVDRGYGLVRDVTGRPLGGPEELIVVDANQEHGIVAASSGRPLDVRAFPVGTPLRVLPNHACATASQHDAYQVVAGGREVEARWERVQGW
jgi:D-serine deaminase-like pyridoxal phosphate-dependent protein